MPIIRLVPIDSCALMTDTTEKKKNSPPSDEDGSLSLFSSSSSRTLENTKITFILPTDIQRIEALHTVVKCIPNEMMNINDPSFLPPSLTSIITSLVIVPKGLSDKNHVIYIRFLPEMILDNTVSQVSQHEWNVGVNQIVTAFNRFLSFSKRLAEQNNGKNVFSNNDLPNDSSKNTDPVLPVADIYNSSVDKNRLPFATLWKNPDNTNDDGKRKQNEQPSEIELGENIVPIIEAVMSNASNITIDNTNNRDIHLLRDDLGQTTVYPTVNFSSVSSTNNKNKSSTGKERMKRKTKVVSPKEKSRSIEQTLTRSIVAPRDTLHVQGNTVTSRSTKNSTNNVLLEKNALYHHEHRIPYPYNYHQDRFTNNKPDNNVSKRNSISTINNSINNNSVPFSPYSSTDTVYPLTIPSHNINNSNNSYTSYYTISGNTNNSSNSTIISTNPSIISTTDSSYTATSGNSVTHGTYQSIPTIPMVNNYPHDNNCISYPLRHTSHSNVVYPQQFHSNYLTNSGLINATVPQTVYSNVPSSTPSTREQSSCMPNYTTSVPSSFYNSSNSYTPGTTVNMTQYIEGRNYIGIPTYHIGSVPPFYTTTTDGLPNPIPSYPYFYATSTTSNTNN